MRIIKWLIVGFLTALALAGCTTQVAMPGPAAALAEAVVHPPANSPGALVQVSPSITATLVAEPDQCVLCHTDKQQLIDTAKPVVVQESESKGVG